MRAERRRADHAVVRVILERADLVIEVRAVEDRAAAFGEPRFLFARQRIRVDGGREIRHRRTGFDQEPHEQEFVTLVARHHEGEPLERIVAHRGHDLVAFFRCDRFHDGRVELQLLADRLDPRVGAADAHGCALDERQPLLHLHPLDGFRIERMERRVERPVDHRHVIGPARSRHVRVHVRSDPAQHFVDLDRIGWEDFTDQVDAGPRLALRGQAPHERIDDDVLRLGVRVHAIGGKRNVHDLGVADLLGQQFER